ncbi:hypothetical protein SeLEV6574_g00068 [Synchytrium endobioticum]|uniref:Transmembrane protein n=1 Tax=Synchytrium endobioticum TaxID=286115 RepID=A0A507DJS6_9FUNG|nr:hypothetical protein SeLEV6574_g00068 [Synchytrium endobioticum]
MVYADGVSPETKFETGASLSTLRGRVGLVPMMDSTTADQAPVLDLVPLKSRTTGPPQSLKGPLTTQMVGTIVGIGVGVLITVLGLTAGSLLFTILGPAVLLGTYVVSLVLGRILFRYAKRMAAFRAQALKDEVGNRRRLEAAPKRPGGRAASIQMLPSQADIHETGRGRTSSSGRSPNRGNNMQFEA